MFDSRMPSLMTAQDVSSHEDSIPRIVILILSLNDVTKVRIFFIFTSFELIFVLPDSGGHDLLRAAGTGHALSLHDCRAAPQVIIRLPRFKRNAYLCTHTGSKNK
jgi:hypothetical protein